MELQIEKYTFDKGPVEEPSLLTKVMPEGNCRLAVQMYFYFLHSLWLKPSEILNPYAYYHTGDFVFKEEAIDFAELKPGDIIYAQRIKNKAGESVNKDLETFPQKDDWIVSLHTAIHLGAANPQIWHATSIENSSCEWTLDKFLNYYKPISVKRVL